MAESSSNFTQEQAGEAWERLRSQGLPALEVDEPPVELEPSEARRGLGREEFRILEDYLEDLGFLPAEPRAATRRELAGAFELWRAADRMLPASYGDIQLLPGTGRSPEVTDLGRLSAQMCFEGQVDLKRLPRDGERSLLSGLVLYRLRTFGLFSSEPGAAFDHAAREALWAGAEALRREASPALPRDDEGPLLELINLLGDAELLGKRLMTQRGNRVFLFELTPASSGAAPGFVNEDAERYGKLRRSTKKKQYEHVFVTSGKHRHSSSVYFHRRDDFGEDGLRHYRATATTFLREQVKRRKRAHVAVHDPVNRLGIQLLQVRLWMIGFYRGEVDGQFGPMSFQAYRQFLKSHGFSDVHKMFIRLKGNYVAINLRYMLKRLFKKVDAQAAKLNPARADALARGLFTESRSARQWRDLEQARSRLRAEDQELFRRDKKRRRYQGLRGLLGAVGRFFGRIGGALIKAIKSLRSAVKKLIGAAIAIFRRGLRWIGRALRVVGLAVKRFWHWLTCEPFVTFAPPQPEDEELAAVLTSFRRDGDAFCFISTAARPALVLRHHRIIERMNLALKIVADLAVEAIDLILTALTQNWLKVVWDLVGLLRSGFWRELRLALGRFKELDQQLLPA